MNAYLLCANAIRDKVRKEKPSLVGGDVTGARYRALSVKGMPKWQTKADAAKEIYKKELAEYKKTK